MRLRRTCEEGVGTVQQKAQTPTASETPRQSIADTKVGRVDSHSPCPAHPPHLLGSCLHNPRATVARLPGVMTASALSRAAAAAKRRCPWSDGGSSEDFDPTPTTDRPTSVQHSSTQPTTVLLLRTLQPYAALFGPPSLCPCNRVAAWPRLCCCCDAIGLATNDQRDCPHALRPTPLLLLATPFRDAAVRLTDF